MRPLRYSINITLDGCTDHLAGIPDEELHRHATETIASADAIIFGRVIYQMMEEAWRLPPSGIWPDWMAPWMQPFARAMDAAKKYVVSNTLTHVDWNSELLRGDLAEAVTALKRQPGNGLLAAGVKLPMTLAEMGLIDEYQFVVHPRVAGHGPYLFAGLPRPLDLKLVGQDPYASGIVALRYAAKR